MEGLDHGLAVVLVQAGPHVGGVRQTRALGNARPSLGMALKCAGVYRLKHYALGRKVFPQSHTLPVTELAQVVVVSSAKRGLSVADKVEISHAEYLS